MRSIELDAGGKGLEDRANDGAAGVCPVCHSIVELLGSILIDGTDADFHQVGHRCIGGGGEFDERIVGQGIGANREPHDMPGQQFLTALSNGRIQEKRVCREVGEGFIAAAEVPIKIESLVGGGGGAGQGQKVANLTDIAFISPVFLGFCRKSGKKKEGSPVVRIGQCPPQRGEDRKCRFIDQKVVRVR